MAQSPLPKPNGGQEVSGVEDFLMPNLLGLPTWANRTAWGAAYAGMFFIPGPADEALVLGTVGRGAVSRGATGVATRGLGRSATNSVVRTGGRRGAGNFIRRFFGRGAARGTKGNLMTRGLKSLFGGKKKDNQQNQQQEERVVVVPSNSQTQQNEGSGDSSTTSSTPFFSRGVTSTTKVASVEATKLSGDGLTDVRKQLETIYKQTSAIKDVTGIKYQNNKAYFAGREKAEDDASRKKRKNKLKGSNFFDGILNKVKKQGAQSLKEIGTNLGLAALLGFYPFEQMIEDYSNPLRVLRDVVLNVTARTINIGNSLKNIKGKLPSLFKNGKDLLRKGFRSVSSGFRTLVRNISNGIKNGFRPPVRPSGGGVTPRGGAYAPRGNTPGRAPRLPTANQAAGKAASARSTVGSGVTKPLSNAARSLFGVKGAERLARASGIFRKIPLIGSLIGVGIDLAMGTPLDEALVAAGGYLIGFKLGALAGGAIGSIVPVIGTAIGAGIGGILGGYLGDFLARQLVKHLKGVSTQIDPLTGDGVRVGGEGGISTPEGSFSPSDMRAGTFVVHSDGTLRVFDGFGTRMPTPSEVLLYESGAHNIDGSRGTTTTPSTTPSTPSSSSSTPSTNKPSSPSSSTSGSAGSWKPILELIASVESVNGSYSSAYPSKIIPGLEQMTIREAIAASGGTDSSGKHYAIGRYQFTTLGQQALAAGFTLDDTFSPEVQDKIAINLITDKRGVTLDMLRNDPVRAAKLLAMEWAGLPVLEATQGAHRNLNPGQSYYAGDGVNAAHISPEQVRGAFGVATSKPPEGNKPVNVSPQTSLPPLPPTGTLGTGAQAYGASRGGGRKHAGVDFDAGTNDSFYSRLGGVVTYVGYDAGGYGHYIDIYNEELGVTERIAEGTTNLVALGQQVAAGTPVQQGTHQTGVFHYEIRKGKGTTFGFAGTMDPISFLNANTNTGSSRPVGSKATLNGKPVTWDGKDWVPETTSADVSDVSPMARKVTSASDINRTRSRNTDVLSKYTEYSDEGDLVIPFPIASIPQRATSAAKSAGGTGGSEGLMRRNNGARTFVKQQVISRLYADG